MYIIGLTLGRENMFIIRYYKTEEKIFLVGYAPSYCFYIPAIVTINHWPGALFKARQGFLTTLVAAPATPLCPIWSPAHWTQGDFHAIS